ncbi:MAG: trehalose-phosphatase [Roseiarcus sp.]|jgi:trehalose 6-phosphate phosphatase
MTATEPPAPKADSICLFLDVDGTLIDLAPTPGAVVVARALLDELAQADRRLGGALALVSGRPIAALDELFAPLRLRASGVHGAEIRYAPEGPTRSLTTARLPDGAWDDLARALARFPGAFAENKGVSFAVHYKLAGPIEAELFAELERLRRRFGQLDLEVIPGNLVFEIKLPGFDKGAAIRRFMGRAPFAGRRPVFIADDRMDGPGFEAVLEMGGIAFSVGFEMAGLTGSFSEPAGVRAWLGKVTG